MASLKNQTKIPHRFAALLHTNKSKLCVALF